MLLKDPAVRRGLHFTNKEMEETRPEKRQAPLLPLRIIAAMELLVVNEDEPSFLRFASWTKLIKVWTSRGIDDLQGISLRSMKFGSWTPWHLLEDQGVGPWDEEQGTAIHGEQQGQCDGSTLVESRPATYDDLVVMTRLVYAKLRECHISPEAIGPPWKAFFCSQIFIGYLPSIQNATLWFPLRLRLSEGRPPDPRPVG
eukprot:s2547_g15.t1